MHCCKTSSEADPPICNCIHSGSYVHLWSVDDTFLFVLSVNNKDWQIVSIVILRCTVLIDRVVVDPATGKLKTTYYWVYMLTVDWILTE